MSKVKAQKVQEALNTNKKNADRLSKRERDILEKYYGIGEKVRHSLQELGDEYSVTRERIRQIKMSALKKIGIT